MPIKTVICNTDILIKAHNDDELQFLHWLARNNTLVFVTHDVYKLHHVREIIKGLHLEASVTQRTTIKNRLEQDFEFRKNTVVFGTKNIDFYLAVNNKLPLIACAWQSCESGINQYGLIVNTIGEAEILFGFIKKNRDWFASGVIDPVTYCVSLHDAKTKDRKKDYNALTLAKEFRNVLKSRHESSFYRILEWYFFTNIAREDLFDDIKIFGVIPSSDGSINPAVFSFAEKIRAMKNVRLPNQVQRQATMESRNLLIRHKRKVQRHGTSGYGRDVFGGKGEFTTMHVNPLYKQKIEELAQQGNLNICILDDYMNYGNGLNAARCIFKQLGANKIILLSLGCFRSQFTKRNYLLRGDVYSPNYTFEECGYAEYIYLNTNDSVNDEISYLYDMFINGKGE